jgi:chlorite dismutase
MSSPTLVTFSAGLRGHWTLTSVRAIQGTTLEPAERLSIVEGKEIPASSRWSLRGVVSNTRYTTRAEADALAAIQPSLGRTEATQAALIPIKKSSAWWALAQDERRAIYEERSRHTSIGLTYLPRIARRLLHSRELGEPFDFLTWFEFAPQNEGAFEELLAKLRATEEWRYVEREVDIRLAR